jgi:hypothetical protein
MFTLAQSLRGAGCEMRFLMFLLVLLSIVICGCGMTVTHVNPSEPNVMGINERIVFGRILFVTHSQEYGNISFTPLGLGLVHVETGNRATRSVILEKSVTVHPITGEIPTHKFQSQKNQWVENDGTFYWVLPTGSYQIDALAWGVYGKVSAEELKEPKTPHIFSLKPEKPPECGFVVSPYIGFSVSGESGALYIGSLLIDMDIKEGKHGGIEVKNINRIEIKDEYDVAMGLLTHHCPTFALSVEKRLMTIIADQSASLANRGCPTKVEMFFRTVVGVAAYGAILAVPALAIPGPAMGITIPSY